jgi:hypothetical protein
MPDLEDFKSDVLKIKNTGLRFLRFYSLGDWGSPLENQYIKAAADITRVELFSKTLHYIYNRQNIKDIASHPSVNISLSFNKSYGSDYIESVFSYLESERLLKNVQLNYTFMADEEIKKIPYISVYHTTSKKKLKVAQALGFNRVCCMKDEDGKKIDSEVSQNHDGSCKKCALCKLPAANKHGEIMVPRLRNV